MSICGHAVKAFCLLAAVTLPAVESHAVGRRLRIRSVADAKGSSGQWPYVAAATANAWRPPIVHFLFLAVGKVNNIDVWKSFFAHAPHDKFRAYVHCKVPECAASVANSPLVPIPVVPSFYCADLVTPMNALLGEALLRSGGANPQDKFVFVSDSTLPAKPFSFIYDSLSPRTGSDFCVCSVKEWATRREQPAPGAKEGRAIELAVKHHQWSVLDRAHAEKVYSIWRAGPSMIHDWLMRFQMNVPPRSRSVKTFAGSSDTGCLDEFYHMAAIYGTMPYSDRNDNTVSLPGFTNTPLHVAPTADLQGSCDTFVAWPEYAKVRDKSFNTTTNHAFNRLYANLDPLSIPYSGNAQKPGYWDTISSHGIRAIRASDFLFVRKFADAPKVTDGDSFGALYPSLVFV